MLMDVMVRSKISIGSRSFSKIQSSFSSN